MVMPKKRMTRTPVKSQLKLNKRKAKKESSKVAVPEEENIYQEPVKRVIRPENQVSLSEEELKCEITRVLTGDDPNVPKNISKYSFKDKCYKLDPPGLSDHMAVHLVLEGCSLHVDSEDYKVQIEQKKRKCEVEAEDVRKSLEQNGVLEPECIGGQGDQDVSTVGPMDRTKNQFNFSDRATQTFNNTQSSRFVCTEPPPVARYSENVSQWQIYDSYVAELLLISMEHKNEKLENKKVTFEGTYSVVIEDERRHEDPIHSTNMERSLKTVERLINQNAQDEVYHDFKYWEDASDQFREGEGSLLPLWRFAYERTKRKQVTALCWNPKNVDLFAVGYGSYDFLMQSSGMICCYSMKNTSFPEYVFNTESGVLSLDFHPQHASLLAVGRYDGNVAVYDVCNDSLRPIYSSCIHTGNHSDPVWQVHWQKEELGKELNLYSISSDGKVVNWSLSKNELKMEPVMQLKLVTSIKDNPEENTVTGLAGGCCFDFNEKQDHLFIVGTEEGRIHKCSKAYSGQYLQTYEGHHMSIYALKWNPFHERLFISCSADWTVKIWDHNLPYPLMSFDLGNSVGDVNWSPHSSTVFSAITSDGKVHLFDLIENKTDSLCAQKIVKRAKLTHLRFNSKESVLIVGDDKGGVNSLKLSPNLRKRHIPTDKDGAEIPGLDFAHVQQEKMEKLISALDIKPPKVDQRA